MKAMNEFAAVVMIGSLILVACVVAGSLFLTPSAGPTSRGTVYSGYAVGQSIELVTQDQRGIAGSHVGPGGDPAEARRAGRNRRPPGTVIVP